MHNVNFSHERGSFYFFLLNRFCSIDYLLLRMLISIQANVINVEYRILDRSFPIDFSHFCSVLNFCLNPCINQFERLRNFKISARCIICATLSTSSPPRLSFQTCTVPSSRVSGVNRWDKSSANQGSAGMLEREMYDS
jgi:hypothetical protein